MVKISKLSPSNQVQGKDWLFFFFEILFFWGQILLIQSVVMGRFIECTSQQELWVRQDIMVSQFIWTEARQLPNNRNLILAFLEARSLSSGYQHSQMRVLFWAANFSLYPQMAEWGRVFCGVSFIRTLIPFMKALPHDLVTPKDPPQKTHLLMPSVWGFFPTYEFWRDKIFMPQQIMQVKV